MFCNTYCLAPSLKTCYGQTFFSLLCCMFSDVKKCYNIVDRTDLFHDFCYSVSGSLTELKLAKSAIRCLSFLKRFFFVNDASYKEGFESLPFQLSLIFVKTSVLS